MMICCQIFRNSIIMQIKFCPKNTITTFRVLHCCWKCQGRSDHSYDIRYSLFLLYFHCKPIIQQLNLIQSLTITNLDNAHPLQSSLFPRLKKPKWAKWLILFRLDSQQLTWFWYSGLSIWHVTFMASWYKQALYRDCA